MRIHTTDRGVLTAEIKGKNLHSKYNPRKEAERFLEKTINEKPSIIVLLGAGLGYIQDVIRDKYREALLLAVHYHDDLLQNSIINDESIMKWSPSSEFPIGSFFNNHIHETKLSGLTILEWEPSASVFKDLSISINLELKKTVQQLHGNIKTTSYFGKVWLKNLLINYLTCSIYHIPKLLGENIVITSSGPSLGNCVEQLKQYRENFLLLALPSSLKFLQSYGIKPDLQISTDPGFYGSVHLAHLFSGVPYLAPLTSSRGAWKKDVAQCFINQDSPFERELISLTSIPHLNIPSNGTVSGTAWEISKRSCNSVFFCGLDLSFSDIRSHVKPHPFDELLSIQSSKINPLYNIYFNRASEAKPVQGKGIRISQSLETYKNWFSRLSGNSNCTIKRLCPSPVDIENIDKGFLEDLPPVKRKPSVSVQKIVAPSPHIRRKNVLHLLQKWENDIQMNVNDEIFYYLDTNGFIKDKDPHEAVTFLKKMQEIYG